MSAFVASTVREAARRFGDRLAMVEADGTSITYAELDTRSDEVAAGLRRAGAGEGAVCALTLGSGTAYLAAYCAAAKVGAAVAGINPRLPTSQVSSLVDASGADVVIATSDDVDRLRVAGGQVPGVDEDLDRPVAIVFTSGTTGAPKGAWFTDRQLRAICAIDSGNRWGRSALEPMIASTQFAHIGFSTKLATYLRLGTTVHVLDRWRPDSVMDLVERHRISTLGVIAPQLALLLGDDSLASRDLSSVSMIVAGGAASPPGLIAAFAAGDGRGLFGPLLEHRVRRHRDSARHHGHR